MKAALKRALLLVLGWGFVLVGIAGLFLPILQGVLMILIGLFILSSEYVWAHHLLEKMKARYPKLAGKLEQAKDKGGEWIRRVFHKEAAAQREKQAESKD
ncbi:MAG TPA: PGPGW domain-containing protein [Terriglobales bacterium]|nr:PGPGW domain-containing protein [Terriglobales bacterium]